MLLTGVSDYDDDDDDDSHGESTSSWSNGSSKHFSQVMVPVNRDCCQTCSDMIPPHDANDDANDDAYYDGNDDGYDANDDGYDDAYGRKRRRGA